MAKLDPRHEPFHSRYLEVTPKKNESPEKMIKRFTKKVREDGILKEIYDRKCYDKPSVKRRKKHQRALFNYFKEQRDSDKK